VRPLPVLAILAVATGPAAADTPAFQLVEDAALGIALGATPVLGDAHVAAMTACKTAEATSGAVFWLELGRAGTVIGAKVRGSGKPAIDACLEAALRKAKPAAKLPGPIALAGHIDLKLADRDGFQPTPRQSKTAVMLPPHAARWQVNVQHLAYTSNRAADLAAALDGASAGIAACAGKRGAKAEPAEAIAWFDGKAIVRSGTPAYDTCVARALETIKLPAPDSATWMKLAILAPAEPLAPRTDKAGLTRDQALRDAMTTAVRSRKEILRTCLDGKANATVDLVRLALVATKATVVKVTGTLDAEIDACVRKKFGTVGIPSAKPEDKLELDIKLDRE
jgi:hypothetical protein